MSVKNDINFVQFLGQNQCQLCKVREVDMMITNHMTQALELSGPGF